jgi:hypothetical protein
MLRGNSAPEVIPGMGIVVQVEQDFQTCDRGFSIGHLKLLVNGWREQQRAHCVQ